MVPVIRSYSPSEVNFVDCKVPVENLLGEEGKGFAICQKWLVHMCVFLIRLMSLVLLNAFELAIEWAKQRESCTKLAGKQAVQ